MYSYHYFLKQHITSLTHSDKNDVKTKCGIFVVGENERF